MSGGRQGAGLDMGRQALQREGGLIQEETPVGGKQACFPRTFEGHVDRPGNGGRRKSSDGHLGELLQLSSQFSCIPVLSFQPENPHSQVEGEARR